MLALILLASAVVAKTCVPVNVEPNPVLTRTVKPLTGEDSQVLWRERVTGRGRVARVERQYG